MTQPGRRTRGHRHVRFGRAIVNRQGNRAFVDYPDRGAAPMHFLRGSRPTAPRANYGSHFAGRHKLG